MSGAAITGKITAPVSGAAGAITAKITSPASGDSKKEDEKLRPKLPILIIPGFMSSGLEVQRSSVEESWTGKRVWINLVSLGFQAYNFGLAKKPTDVSSHFTEPSTHGGDAGESSRNNESSPEDEERARQLALHNTYKNMWIQHMALSLEDMCSEHPGVAVRPMKGLAAVDYLTPGTLTDHVSYVFGPVIKALQSVGYEEGVNLDAAPYDWRLPPSALEERDGYFSRTMEQVERLYEANGGTPVVLVCHSLGCKAGHYFLNFAEKKQRGWADKYVHTYMPVGAPHLGAPKALRASVTGDKMGLDAFLSDDEATAMGRSFGSAPWMIPETMPTFAPAVVHIRDEGAFEITVRCTIKDVSSLLQHRQEKHRPKKLRLTFKLGKETVASRFEPLEEDGSVSFEQKFIFATGPDGPNAKRCCCCRCVCCECCHHNEPPRGDYMVVSLCEPGLQAAKTGDYWKACCWSDDCMPLWLKIITLWWVIRWTITVMFFLIYFFIYQGWVWLGDCINRQSGDSSVLASGEVLMHDFVDADSGRDKEVELLQTTCCMCCKKRGVLTMGVNIRWISPDPEENESERCHIAVPQSKGLGFRHIGKLLPSKNKDQNIVPTSGFDILKKEGNDPTIRAVEKMYDTDPLDPRGRSSSSPPPVNRIKAIYGINLPTEVGAIYKRQKAVIEKDLSQVTHIFKLDRKAQLQRKDLDGYVNEDGILKETQSTPQMLVGSKRFRQSAVAKDFKRCSGDGTVPYWSLQHVRTWEDSCKVSVTEIEGAEHRDILADKRFHEELIAYVATKYSGDAEEKV